MMDVYSLVIAFVVGMMLGAFFSLNLWSSVKKMVDENTPWYVLFGNFLLRISVVVIGLSLVMAGRWENMAAALAGFVIMRVVMAHFLGKHSGDLGRAAWRS